jgi:tripartite-type tricarboxylate transporter receptor subunit TctC
MIDRRRLLEIAAASALVPGVPRLAGAQGSAPWPQRFVRLIVPFPPGGGTDAIARVIATKLSTLWGHQVVIENRGGAATNIGTEVVARADPDGYTLLLHSMPFTVNRFLFRSLPYDPVADFIPVSVICDYPNVMAVPITSPAHSVQEFIDHARRNRGKVTYASSGHGTSVHLAGELFRRMANVELTHVPYRGAGPALNDLIPGRVDVMFNNIGAVLPMMKSGKLRGLAVTSASRTPLAPEFPTVAESGVPGFDVTAWYGVLAPARTPAAIVARIHDDIVAAVRDPQVKARLDQLGVGPIASSPDEFRRFLEVETQKWGAIIREAGIKVEE